MLIIIDLGIKDVSQDIVGDGIEVVMLKQVGIDWVLGIIVGSDNDVNNFFIVMMVIFFWLEFFVVMWQNYNVNILLFEVFKGDFLMIFSYIVVQESIVILIMLLFVSFFIWLYDRSEDDCW